jgi:hypothetical protein
MLGQVLHIDGNLFRTIIDVNVHDVEDLVVVTCPYLYCTVGLKAGLCVHQYGFELYLTHSTILYCSNLSGYWMLRYVILFEHLVGAPEAEPGWQDLLKHEFLLSVNFHN